MSETRNAEPRSVAEVLAHADELASQFEAMGKEEVRLEIDGDETVRILVNDNVTMTPKKMAAQAVHAALAAYGIPHGRVVVLGGRPGQIEKMPVKVRDAGATELTPGTLTAGCQLERDSR